MKTLALKEVRRLCSAMALTGLATAALADGALNVDNRLGPGIEAPVYDTDCKTRLAGDAYLAQAYIGLRY